MPTTIESLELEVMSNSTSAVSGISALSASLSKLKNAVKGGVGLTSVTNQLKGLNNSLLSIDGSSASKLDTLCNSLSKLSGLGNIKLSSSIANQLKSIGGATTSIKEVDFSGIGEISSALTPLTSLSKSNLTPFITSLNKVPLAVQGINNANLPTFATNIKGLVSSLAPLSEMGKNQLTSFITQLNKIPQLMENMKKVDMKVLYNQIQSLTRVFRPLANEMLKISQGFSSFPTKIQRMIQSTDKLAVSNKSASTSYINLWAKCRMAMNAVKSGGRTIAAWTTESNSYIENLNLFTASMGKYASEAQKYAEQVGEVMGIDPGQWMRNQGVFMTVTEGFGIASDRAYTMSKNLTQLGYDLSSFFNISFEDAMQKLQSGISGELEPLRRLGYDLSQARLQAVGLSLGIDKAFTSMNQAEKAQLRYYAIMKQVTVAQGDMARTLNAPANQLRIMKAQVTQCSRAFGNIFIPVLNVVLPYVIAFTKIVRMAANAVSSLFGFQLPEVDYSGISAGGSAVGEMADELGDATKKAKKFKNSVLGIDELNILSHGDESDSDIGNTLGGGDLGFKLPEYDFLKESVTNRVLEIVDKFKEWSGLTDDIDTWAEFFQTKLGRILSTVGAIALGLATWKISRSVLKGIAEIIALNKAGLGKALLISVGLSLFVGSVTLLIDSIRDALQLGLNGMNFTQMLAGALGLTGSGALLGKAIIKPMTALGKTLTGSLIGGAIGAIGGGITLFITGIWLATKDGIDWLIASLITASGALAGAGIGALIGSVGGPLGAAIGALVGIVVSGVIAIVQYWDVIAEWCEKVATAIGQFFANTWKSIVGVWNVVADWFNTQVVRPITTFFMGLWEGIVSLAQGCWDGIVAIFSPVIEWFSELFNSVWQTISDVFYNIGVIASGCWEIIKRAWSIVSAFFHKTVIQPVGDYFTFLWNKVTTTAITAWDKIKVVFSKISTWVSETIVQPVGLVFTKMWNGFSNGAKIAWESVKSVFGNVAEFFGDIFSTAWRRVVNVFSVAGEIFIDIKDGVLEGFMKIVNGLIGGINNVIALPFKGINTVLSSMKELDILGIRPFAGLRNINIPQIPTFANGGFPDAGQMFIAREAGPELVGRIGTKTAVANNGQIVESIERGVFRAVERASGKGGGGNWIIQLVDTNGKIKSETVISEFERNNCKNGKTAIPVGT